MFFSRVLLWILQWCINQCYVFTLSKTKKFTFCEFKGEILLLVSQKQVSDFSHRQTSRSRMPYITHFKSTKGTDEVIHLKNIMVYYYRVEEGVLTFFRVTRVIWTPQMTIFILMSECNYWFQKKIKKRYIKNHSDFLVKINYILVSHNSYPQSSIHFNLIVQKSTAYRLK